MSNQKLLSISIPTWNRSKLIHELLEGLIAQILKYNLSESVEIVVSNNGSEDNTHEIVEELKSKYSFITYNRNPVNLGANPNVMKSMELASAEFLIFLGDDDRIEDGSLARIIEYIKAHKDAGIIIDSSKFKNKSHIENDETNLNDLLRNYYWNIGNAGVFIVRSSYVKESLSKYKADFFNQCWSQTQFMILGSHEHKNNRIYVNDLGIISHSVHQEVTIYNSFYLWMGAYYDLFRAIKDLENIVDKQTYISARQYLKNNITQLFFNFLQCGVYIDDPETRRKTRKHIQKYLKLFSTKEKIYMFVAIITLGLPTFISRFLCNIFILLLKGKAGIVKKNEFVKTEKNKKEQAKRSKSITVRNLELEG
jgi:glycosyltransferase involved in cell wall biosynthesis